MEQKVTLHQTKNISPVEDKKQYERQLTLLVKAKTNAEVENARVRK